MNNFNFLSKTPKEIDKLIAARIRNIRRRRKISQKRLSEKSGVSLGSVKRFEQLNRKSLKYNWHDALYLHILRLSSLSGRSSLFHSGTYPAFDILYSLARQWSTQKGFHGPSEYGILSLVNIQKGSDYYGI